MDDIEPHGHGADRMPGAARWLAGGAALVGLLAIARRRPALSLWLAMAAGAAAGWALATARRPDRRNLGPAVRRDVVETASRASFPASDPPPWTDSHAQARD